MISDEELAAFERRLASFQHTEFSGGTRNFLRHDVPFFIEKVRRMQTDLSDAYGIIGGLNDVIAGRVKPLDQIR
jgi:hypothetical protein